jgi:Flp pilus assembly protein TadG
MFCDMGRSLRDRMARTSTRIGNVAGSKAKGGQIGFVKNERGNLTMVFAFSLAAAVSFVGMTVDFGRGFATKAAIDRALDGAALAGGRKFDQTGNMEMAAAAARAYFYKVLPRGVTASLTSVKADAHGNISMSAKTNIKTMFLGAVGIQTIGIKRDVASLAMDANAKKVEIALVMDVTGSMSQNQKLVTAKAAAKQLINTLMPAGVPAGNVRISVVPFSEYVNAGSYAPAATGVASVTTTTVACVKPQTVCTNVSNAGDGHSSRGHGWDHGNHGNQWGHGHGHNRCAGDSNDNSGSGSNNQGSNSQGGNQSSNNNDDFDSHGYDDDGFDRDGYDDDGHDDSGHTRAQNGDTTVGTHQVCTTQQVQSTCTTTSYVNTCMAERLAASGHAYDDAAPSTALFHAFTTTSANNTNCTAPAAAFTPLTSDKTVLNAALDALSPAGYTGGHLGTAWGWYTLSDKWTSFWPAGSKPDANDPAKVTKAVIVMTDGAYNVHYDNNYASVQEDNNNSNPAAGNGRSRDQAAAICTAMKAAGVQVFTVGLELGSDAASKTALQACASPANAQIAQHYYDVSSATNAQSGLTSVFSEIAIKLAASTGTGNARSRLTQ